MREMLRDPARTGLVIVATPEEMPVQETLDLVALVDERTQTPIGAVVVNRVHPELFSRDDEAVFRALRPLGDEARNLYQAGELALAIRHQQASQVDDLRAALRSNIPLVFIPQTFGESAPRAVSDEVVEAFAAEIDE
jgi:anion-transporting  ArsA/GET3 family ATPase